MASGWTPEPCDYAALHFLLIAALVAIATAFDLVAHHITHRLDDGHDAGSRGKTFTERLDPMLWKRVQAELTVLGFLALAIWISRHAGLLEAVTAWAYSVRPQDTFSHRRLGAAPSPSDAAPPVNGSLAECRSPVESLAAILPTEQASLLHSLEDVHVTLFATMLCYFCGVRLAVGLVSGRLRALAEIDADGAEASPAAASRSGGREESSRARQLRRALSVGEGAPLVPQLADNMAREVEALVEFGTGAWLLILAYDLALLAAFALPCDDDLPFPWLRVFFLAPGVVVGLRLLAHARHLRQQDGASGAADVLWPCPMLERLSCACTGGTLGAYPCCGPPSSRAGLTFLQALLFFNIYVLVETATDSFTYSAIAGGGLWPRDPVALMQVAIARLYPRPTEIARVYPGPPEIVRDGARSRDPVGPRAARQRAALVHAPRARAALRLRAAALQGAAAAARRPDEGRVRVVGRGGRPRAVSGDLGRSRGVGRACAAEPRESASRGLPGPAWPRAARALGGVAAAASRDLATAARPASVGGGSAGRDAFGAAE